MVKKILVVDDIIQNLKLLVAILKSEGYKTETAVNGREAVDKSKSFMPDLILLDIMMPDMNGYEACTLIKSDPSTNNIPIVMVTALDDRESMLRGLRASANDFLTKPFDRTELVLRVKNLLKVKEYEDFMMIQNEVLEKAVKERTMEVQQANETIKESYIETIYRLTLVAEYKDQDTATHIKRIGYYCELISGKLGLSGDFAETMKHASPMHDIGKVGIPDDILLKRGLLTPREFERIKTHTTIGAKILSDSVSDFLQAAKTIALTHHERWDGKGYPEGLKGEDIPLMGRITNLVDQYDSLRSKRPYKPGFTHEQAYSIITKGDGRTSPDHFDPAVLDAFIELEDEFNTIFEENQEQPSETE